MCVVCLILAGRMRAMVEEGVFIPEDGCSRSLCKQCCAVLCVGWGGIVFLVGFDRPVLFCSGVFVDSILSVLFFRSGGIYFFGFVWAGFLGALYLGCVFFILLVVVI